MARYICLVFKYTAEPIALCIDIIILGDPGADSRGEKHKSFLAPIRSHNGGDRLELVW